MAGDDGYYGDKWQQRQDYVYGYHQDPRDRNGYYHGASQIGKELDATDAGQQEAEWRFGRANEGRYYGLQSRGQEQGALDMMSAAAHGQVPSAADMSMRQGMAQNQMAQMGAANMGRGNAGSAMAQRSSMMGGAGAQMQAIHAGGAARSGEIGDAQHAYGMGLSHARAGDNTLMNNSLAQAASMDAANRGWFGARQNINQAQLDANVYMENLAAGNLEQANALARSQKHDETAAALAAGEGAAAGATKLWSGSKDGSGDDGEGTSDERRKTSIRDAGSNLAAMHSAMRGY